MKGFEAMKYQPYLIQLSSLEKVFLDEEITNKIELEGATALKGERLSYQVLYRLKNSKCTVPVSVLCDPRIRVILRRTDNVPVVIPALQTLRDEWLLRDRPGLYPDVLTPIDGTIDVTMECAHSLYVTCEIPEDLPAGEYPIDLSFTFGDTTHVKTFKIKVLNAVLPPQEVSFTQWFHPDCIANYYGYEMYSEPHWAMLDKFMKAAKRAGLTMLLTPVFTLPLDTAKGAERPTHQLLDITLKRGKYKFGFKRLKRWLDLCRKNGIYQFEISHFFTQWGTARAPKVVAKVDGKETRIFGWETDVFAGEYEAFLAALIPELTAFLKKEGVWDECVFHVSDEPHYPAHYEIYKWEYTMLSRYLPKEKIMDAMSSTVYAENGLATRPTVLTPEVEKFQNAGFSNIWMYTCCVPANEGYANRFIAMPSGRTRMTGLQLYQYDIHGFLHWGFNYYYTELARKQINPFMVTDAGDSFPAGDSFTVYPGEDGPLESLRAVSFFEGLQDHRACRLLESLTNRGSVLCLLEQCGMEDMNHFPRTNDGVLAIRQRINEEIEKALA
ncbi:MAG: DUF4091 domain-containing protein [Clostridia bacterium]|nr:DUF4091 domain-containing protein [Clostridia bacterium]